MAASMRQRVPVPPGMTGLTSSKDHWEHHWTVAGVASGSVIAGCAMGVRYTVGPAQTPYTRSYSAVQSKSQHGDIRGAQRFRHISRFKHFWHRVLAEALVAGARSPGAFR